MNKVNTNQVYVPSIQETERLGWFERQKYWAFHQQNLAQLVLLQGITIKAYIHLYQLNRKQAYKQLRCVGVAKLRRQFWAIHRKRYQDSYLPSGKSVQEYIQDHQLSQKTAALELKRRLLSAEWESHRQRFNSLRAKTNITIAEYAKTYRLIPSTARRYLHKP